MSEHPEQKERECDRFHGRECGCNHDHDHDNEHECSCDHEHGHIDKGIPAVDFDVAEMGLGWEGVCPCGCGGAGHHEDGSGGMGGSEAEAADTLAWRTWVNAEPDTYEEFQQGYAFDHEGNLLAEMEDEVPPEPALLEFDFDHDGVLLHVRRWGTPGEIPLVVLHGFMQTGASWAQVAPWLAQGHCVYAPDLVGHGCSDAPDDPAAYGLAAQADAVAALIEQVALPQAAEAAHGHAPARRAHVMGYSMGGRVALDVMLRHGNLVYSLILESAGLGPADEEERAALAERDAQWAQMLRERGIGAFVDQWERLPLFATQARLSDEAKAAVRAERESNDPQAMARVLEAAGQHAMALADENLEALATAWVPVLYLAGTRDPKYLELAERFMKEGLDAKPVMGGHNLHLEAPALFAEALGAHFRSNEVRGI